LCGPKTLGKQLAKTEKFASGQPASGKLRSPTGQLFSFPAGEIVQGAPKAASRAKS